MRPILFHIGSIGVPSFFFTAMLASLSAVFYALWRAKREGANPVVILDFGIMGVLSAVVGTRLMHVLVEQPAYYWKHPIEIFYFWQGGFVSIGGILLAAISFLCYLKIRKLERWRYLDLISLGMPFVVFFVRTGCLLVGCCYGKPTDWFFHLTFTNPHTEAALAYPGIPLYPSQIFGMINGLIMFIVLNVVYARRRFYGAVFSSFLIYYGVTRFVIEFFRGDVDRGIFFDGMLSTGQISMIFFFISGLLLWQKLKNRYPIPQ